jgi:FkbM family methyltransferase
VFASDRTVTATYALHERQILDARSRLKRNLPDGYRQWRASTAGELEDIFHLACSSASVQSLIECGAHAAETSVRFIAEHPNRRAVAVEANPKTYESRTRPAESLGVETCWLGVGAEEGTMSLNVPTTEADVSGMPLNASFFASLRQRPSGHEVLVPVTTVDALQSGRQLPRPLAVWIDVEGFAYEVISGAKETLPHVEVALVEVESETIWDGQSTDARVIEAMRKVGLHPVARDCQMGELQYNILFLRRLTPELDARIRRYRKVVSRPRVGTRLRARTAAGILRSKASALRSLRRRTSHALLSRPGAD